MPRPPKFSIVFAPETLDHSDGTVPGLAPPYVVYFTVYPPSTTRHAPVT